MLDSSITKLFLTPVLSGSSSTGRLLRPSQLCLAQHPESLSYHYSLKKIKIILNRMRNFGDLKDGIEAKSIQCQICSDAF